MRQRVLFLCTGNSIRSQMAEGLASAFHSDEIEAVAEKGIDISGATSKSAEQFLSLPFDVVVTVCDSAADDCPTWPGARRIEHWSIPDPINGAGDPMPRFRAVRDDLERRIAALFG